MQLHSNELGVTDVALRSLSEAHASTTASERPPLCARFVLPDRATTPALAVGLKFAIVSAGYGKLKVGSRSLRLRFTDDTGHRSVAAVGPDASLCTKVMEDSSGVQIRVKLQVWDHVLDPRSEVVSMATALRGSFKGVVVCYDISNSSSLLHVRTIFKDIARNTAPGCLPVVVVGTKSDLTSERQLTHEAAMEFVQQAASDLHVDVIGVWEVSAKENWNVDDAFAALTHRTLQSSN